MELAGVDAGEKMLGLAGEVLVAATAASDDSIRRVAEDQDRLQCSFPVFSPTLNSNISLMNQSRRIAHKAQTSSTPCAGAIKLLVLTESGCASRLFKRN
jgi:hypothetical protein